MTYRRALLVIVALSAMCFPFVSGRPLAFAGGYTSKRVLKIPPGKYQAIVVAGLGAPGDKTFAATVTIKHRAAEYVIAATAGHTFLIPFAEGWAISATDRATVEIVVTTPGTDMPGVAPGQAEAWGVSATGPVEFPKD
jgi:hypothetical protein